LKFSLDLDPRLGSLDSDCGPYSPTTNRIPKLKQRLGGRPEFQNDHGCTQHLACWAGVGSLYVDGQYQASDQVSQAGFTGFSRAAAVCPRNFERR
jgi:hypothetical protein